MLDIKNTQISPTQIQQWRFDTPGTNKYIHLNNAGASLPPQSVVTAMQQYIAEEATRGGYETAEIRADLLNRFYTNMASMLNCQARNIAACSSATDGFCKAIQAIDFQEGDVILTTDDDYVSNQIVFLNLVKRYKIQLIRAKTKPSGGVDVDSMKKLMDQYHPKLVSVTHIPTNSGLVQDVEAIGQLCKSREIIYIIDACQSAGQMPLDVQKIGCDFMSATFRKFMRGPRGMGFLYVSDRVLSNDLAPLYMDMKGANWVAPNEVQLVDDAGRFQYWEQNYALMAGASAAIAYALTVGLENIRDRARALAQYTRQELRKIDQANVLDQGEELGAIVTVHLEGMQAEYLKQQLSKYFVNTSVAQRSSALIDFDKKGVNWALRLSPHYYNTKEEIDQTIYHIKKNINQ